MFNYLGIDGYFFIMNIIFDILVLAFITFEIVRNGLLRKLWHRDESEELELIPKDGSRNRADSNELISLSSFSNEKRGFCGLQASSISSVKQLK